MKKIGKKKQNKVERSSQKQKQKQRKIKWKIRKIKFALPVFS